ncbi:EscU/YscU/HrcU family type III secretion system export apparatus switch protein [Pseudorhodobacter wandonensis]|uniref:EscU/YscU/HrcU family type III secretion system export apparatus switch protein n=1 Tax=Pseudorhodobacter wandonensis TaxID=1120568 RepID=UPI00067ABDB5|nr:flagellar type III secretion system protein FlhB [Pseudorhodobacter wandonensis]
MSDEQSPSDKEHEATDKKLSDAREKGEIPRSNDLITAGAYLGFLLAGAALGASMLTKSGEAAAAILEQSDRLSAVWTKGAGRSVFTVLATVIGPVAPFFLIPFATATLMILAQRAMIFTPSKLAPKLNRISPISGIKNKLGRKGLFEFFKSFVKLLIISVLLFSFLSHQADDLLRMIYLSPAVSIAMLFEIVIRFLAIIAMLVLAIGGIDYFWQRAEHFRSNKMSRKELMDEHKNAEGDPHTKAKRRQRGQEIATNRMLQDVRTADVVIVNPTHFAVALKWDRLSGRAPICVAKGVDEIAQRIRERAAEAAIPLHSDPPTARMLFASLDVGQEVHPDHYRVVAAAIRYSESIRQRKTAAQRGPD